MADRLEQLISEHLHADFPPSILKGVGYGRVDPVMIDADIYGWAVAVDRDGELDESALVALREAREDLAASLSELPPDALSYYEQLLVLADEALLESDRGA